MELALYHPEYQYLAALGQLLEKAERPGFVPRADRTGVGTVSIFGSQMRWDLSKGFPLLTTKKLHTKSIIHELLWFLSGDTNIKYLNDNGVTIWDEWADENGDLGPVYGKQWRRWDSYLYLQDMYPDHDDVVMAERREIDQISLIVDQLKNNPMSRRMIVSGWNPADVPDMALPPCHTLFHFFVEDGKLSCQLYQRSADMFLGVPFNIASYALLTMMMAQVAGLEPGEFVHTMGDMHLYMNHIEQAKLQIRREPRQFPIMRINPMVKDIFDFRYEDFTLEGYDPHPHIKADIAI